MEITHKRHYEQIKIYINGVLHLQFKLLDFVGLQSWIHGEREYFIEYYFSGGSKITTAYSDKEKWKLVLEEIDKAITVIG